MKLEDALSQRTQTARYLRMMLMLISTFAMLLCSALTSQSTNSIANLQATMSGDWTAEFDPEKADAVRMMFHRRTGRGGSNMSNSDIPLAELQGLTRPQAFSKSAPVNFRIVREAGTFTHEGHFREGKGSGQWKLSLNENFISALRSRGYDNLGEERLLAAAMHDLTTKFIEDLKSAGYDRRSMNSSAHAYSTSHRISSKRLRRSATNAYCSTNSSRRASSAWMPPSRARYKKWASGGNRYRNSWRCGYIESRPSSSARCAHSIMKIFRSISSSRSTSTA